MRKQSPSRLSFTRRACLAGAGGLVFAGLPGAMAQPRAERPNIVVIVLDDVGFSDLGAFGGEIRTPAIDQLAQDGLRYNRFDSKAVCTPTRAALLTGRNPQTVRMSDLPAAKVDPADLGKDRGELPRDAQTIAQVLRRSGYRTYGLGKWHLAPEDEDGSPGRNGSWPLQRGFDSFYGFASGWTDQYRPSLIEGNHTVPAPIRTGYHFSADITDRAIAALTPQKDKGWRPAFVYLAYAAAHSPIQVPRPYIDAYRGAYDQGWDALRSVRLARMKQLGIVPANTQLAPRSPSDRLWKDLTLTEKAVFARFMETYAGFITHTDEQIGRLIAHLKATGQYDNTLIVLLSDNGAASEAGQKGFFDGLYRPNNLTPEQMLARIDELGSGKTQAEYQRPWAMASVTPFRRYKVWPYLGGVRTPLIVAWRRVIRDGGAIRTQFVDTVDIAPTLAAAAGTAFPRALRGAAERSVAGKSILATMRSATAPSSRSIQYFELRGNRAITAGRWRAVAIHTPGTDFASDKWQLFDTQTDFSEAHDLADRYPGKVAELKQLWWREARRYSDPPLAEMPARFRNRERFDDSPDRGPPTGTGNDWHRGGETLDGGDAG